MSCKWAESQPTGVGNLSIPDESQVAPKEDVENVPNEEEQEQEQIIPSNSNICENLLLRITLTSTHSQPVRFKMSFDGLQDHLTLPSGGIKDFIRPGMTSHILTLKRISTNPLDLDFGKNLQISFKYKPHPGTDFEMSQYASQSDRPKAVEAPKAIEAEKPKPSSEIRDQRRSGISVDAYHEGLVEKNDDFPQEFEQKPCPICTLLNDFDATVCEVCGSIFS